MNYKNEMGFLPRTPNDPCDNTWRVVNSACWAAKVYSGGGHNLTFGYNLGWLHLVLLPCGSAQCCTMNLRVCRYSTPPPDYITIDTLGSSNGEDSCATLERIIWVSRWQSYDTLQCNEICFWISNVQTGGYYGKQAFMIENEIEELIKSEKLIIQMKQYDNYLDFNLLSEFKSNDFKITIYSLYGESLLENSYELNEGKNHYNIQLDNLRSGFYFITIQIDGIIQKSEKIIIVR